MAAVTKPSHGPSAAAVAAIRTTTGKTTRPPTTKAAIASSGANSDREMTEDTRPISVKSLSEVYRQSQREAAECRGQSAYGEHSPQRQHAVGGALQAERFSGIRDGLHDAGDAAELAARVDRLQRLLPVVRRQPVEISQKVGFIVFDFPFAHAAEMADKPAAEPGDELPVLFGCRLEGEIALGVRAHRAVVEVGGTYAQQIIVDDHHLAVHHDRSGRGLASRVAG